MYTIGSIILEAKGLPWKTALFDNPKAGTVAPSGSSLSCWNRKYDVCFKHWKLLLPRALQKCHAHKC